MVHVSRDCCSFSIGGSLEGQHGRSENDLHASRCFCDVTFLLQNVSFLISSIIFLFKTFIYLSINQNFIY